ncbi:coiled-coil protein [Tritrichomonas foetus]|uniref:Coiled-coil protein n=1 Tax=Tritrichomonas foetus TaxID=1144522 RepID=A0A1J4JN35_9EUKA|nr:coiled-coil protein [Tritrichomonas foetus]|eukprot:OHS98668.1 coiled-coil protein [Tritrichomonas foetus]
MTLKSQFESELQKLTASIQLTNDTVVKSQAAKDALTQFSTTETGKEMLVPITESMYVPGVVQETKRPIIELGTGYFAETSVENATAFFSRRIARLNKQQDSLRNSFKEKQSQYQITVQTINQKLQQSRRAPQQ